MDTSKPSNTATSIPPVLSHTSFAERPKENISPAAENVALGDGNGQPSTTDDAKLRKRRLFGFGKKKDQDKDKTILEGNTLKSATAGIVAPILGPISSSSPPRFHPNHPYQSPSSPQRNPYSTSPHIISPAGSQIFERDVQESSVPMPSSPAIPSHIQTENHIPAVLDASSEAITNDTLDPDTVEIVMHSAHQPASVAVTGILSPMDQSWTSSWADELISHPDKDDLVSNPGTLDAADVRRLSFISFSDIVQSEHAEHAGSRDSIYVAGLSSLSSGQNRSPSPMRSPVSSPGFSASPPTSKSASIKGFDMSPRGRPLGSPISAQASLGGGELTIETMTQALRRTGSGDLSGCRGQPLSPSSPSS